MTPIITGGMINAALFLAGIIVAGVASGNHWAVVQAIGSAGVAVIDYSSRQADHWKFAGVMWAVSNGLAAASAAVLVLGYLT